MRFERGGFEVFPEIVPVIRCEELIHSVTSLATKGAGSRDLLDYSWIWELAQEVRSDARLRGLLSGLAPVQCTYFDKSQESNWLVTFHQDLSIPVCGRVASSECRGWSEKQGVTFVQPPVFVLESLVAVRIHLDESHERNGPMRVLAGTHLYGRIKASEVDGLRTRHQEVTCVAARGAALVLRPLLLHASSKSEAGQPRRVLHFLFGPKALPEGLQWRAAAQQDAARDTPASAASPLRRGCA